MIKIHFEISVHKVPIKMSYFIPQSKARGLNDKNDLIIFDVKNNPESYGLILENF